MFSPNVEEVDILFRLLGCPWLLMIFVVSSISLILSLVLSSSRFFIISVNRFRLFFLWVAVNTKGFSLLCFSSFLNSLCDIFSANLNPLFIRVPLWFSVVCSSLRQVFFRFYPWLLCIKWSGTLAQRLECSPMARETWVQSQVESYQRL